MAHKNFYIIKAGNNYELGFLTGQKFAPMIGSVLQRAVKRSDWKKRASGAKDHIKINREYFPDLMDELEGQAKGANIDFIDLWTLFLEGEANPPKNIDKCTTIVTNNGSLIAHNEDWEESSENDICFVLKELGGLNILEIRYYHTLGGDSISINSNGFVTAVNSLYHTDSQIGVSRNMIARWLSQTKDPSSDLQRLKRIPRASGYSHTIINLTREIWNVESTAKKSIVLRPNSPFVHTNHYLSKLRSFEANNNSSGTIERYKTAISQTKPIATAPELRDLSDNSSNGETKSIMNKRTIAKMLIDTKNLSASGWLRTEREKGWIDYDLQKLLGIKPL